jgi:hypothetical protein
MWTLPAELTNLLLSIPGARVLHNRRKMVRTRRMKDFSTFQKLD